ncbi:hypothetical protein SAMN04489761_3080 [Tenacibaculum sp. MAR_2009_124]|uniref:hypothetical protein n=1 Tax=Tenacibaculum sp. MAR_2009_124 TaxID=1250059 RepID=UPI000896EC53|nr:hypothetical protein [Tenacibaculum sp. MAR_2009_124]SEC46951.1 hypothetical protein SAMN04489761_3080 [Tenacibaculum sp. MAR_2009_124]
MSNKPIDKVAIKRAEGKIGNKASSLIQNKLESEIASTFRKSKNPDESLLESLKVSKKMGNVRLFGIRVNMAKHGFVHQHGVNGDRIGHVKERNIPRKTFYTVKEHGMILRKQPFIEMAVESSGAFEYVFNELGKLRMKEVELMFGNQLKVK